MPVTAPEATRSQLLMNISKFGRNKVPMVMSQLNIRPVFDVHADVQGRDLQSAAAAIDEVIAANKPDPSKAIKVTLSGQVETMRESFSGLFTGMALAVVLVYLLLVINFQSCTDSAHRALGRAVRAGRGHVDAVPDADAYKRASSDGDAYVHRPHHREQHSGGYVLQSAH